MSCGRCWAMTPLLSLLPGHRLLRLPEVIYSVRYRSGLGKIAITAAEPTVILDSELGAYQQAD